MHMILLTCVEHCLLMYIERDHVFRLPRFHGSKALIEIAVEMDDAAMEAYLEGNEPDEATLRSAFHDARGAATSTWRSLPCLLALVSAAGERG